MFLLGVGQIDAKVSFWAQVPRENFTAYCRGQYDRMLKGPLAHQRLSFTENKYWEPRSKPKPGQAYPESVEP